MNNYHITILYYYVFYLASFGLNAEVVNFEVKSIQAPNKFYNCGILTYFPKSDQSTDPNHYVFLETDVPTLAIIELAIQNWLDQNTLEAMTNMLIDRTSSTAGGMYKIMQEEIEHYVYDDKNDVSIVHKGYGFTLNFTSIEDAKKFIDTLPSSITVMDPIYFRSLQTLTENFRNLTTF